MTETTDISELIQQRLADARSVADMVDGRLRPDSLEETETLPAIRYELLSSDPYHHLQAAAGYAESRLQIAIAAC